MSFKTHPYFYLLFDRLYSPFSHHYCDWALISERFTGLSLPGTILLFSHEGKVSGYELVIILKKYLTVKYVRLTFSFFLIFVIVPINAPVKKKKQKQVGKSDRSRYMHFTILYSSTKSHPCSFWSFNSSKKLELVINLKLVSTFNPRHLMVYREGKWKHQTSQI